LAYTSLLVVDIESREVIAAHLPLLIARIETSMRRIAAAIG